jgi:uncharacterized protein involved in exopolysaccharide biosynthesis
MEEDTLRTLLHAVFKHWSLISSLFVITTCAGMLSTLLTVPVYEASSMIILGVDGGFSRDSRQASLKAREDREIRSEMEMIRSGTVILKVIQDLGIGRIYPGIERDALMNVNPFLGNRGALERALLLMEKKGVRVERMDASDIIRVSFCHHDPATAAQVVNALVGRYLEHRMCRFDKCASPTDACKGDDGGTEARTLSPGCIISIRMVEPALPPVKPVKPDLGRGMLLSLAAGTLAVVAMLGAALLLDHRFHTKEDVTRHLGLTVLASLTEVKHGCRRGV